MALLDIKNLTVAFDTSSGPFMAVDGHRSMSIERAKCWPSSANPAPASRSSMLAVMGLLPPTATVTADRMSFDGTRPAEA